MQISPSVLSSGLSSLQSGQRRAEQAASEIARAALPPAQETAGINASATPPVSPSNPGAAPDAPNAPDLATSLVALNVGKVEAQAGVKLIETADDVLGTLLDTRA